MSDTTQKETTEFQGEYKVGTPEHKALITQEIRDRDDVLRLLRAEDFSQNAFDENEIYEPFIATRSFLDFVKNIIYNRAIFIHSTEKHEAMARALNKPNPSLAYYAGSTGEGEVHRLHISINQDEYILEINGREENFQDLMIYSIIHELYEAWGACHLGSEYLFDRRSPDNIEFPTAHDRANHEEYKAVARDGELERLKTFYQACIIQKMDAALAEIIEQKGSVDEEQYWRDVSIIIAEMGFMMMDAQNEAGRESGQNSQISDDEYWLELAKRKLANKLDSEDSGIPQ